MRTLFKCKCPECGHVGTAEYFDHPIGQVRCNACGALFFYEQNTYRPATQGMTDAERLQRKRDYARLRHAEHRDEINARKRAYYEANKYRLRERARKYAAEHREQRRRYNRSEAGKQAKRRWRQQARERFRETGEVPAGHGKASAYQAGCRCDECRRWRYESYCAEMERKMHGKQAE